MFQYKAENVFTENENIAVTYHTNPNEPVHTHDFLELVYIVSGKGKQCVDGKEYTVARGDFLFINYGQTHAFSSEKGMEYYNIYMHPSVISEELINADNAFLMLALTSFEDFRESVGENHPVVRFSAKGIPEVETCIKAIKRELQAEESGSDTVIKSYLMVLLTYMFRKMAVYEDVQGERHGKIQELIQYIEENCTKKLSLEELANQCFYNPSYFCRVFKEYSGVTVTEFIHESRIRKSCDLLKNTSMSIEDISRQVGYTNKTSFYKRFRAQMSVSPADFRAEQKK